ncbi:DarT ssDNA thymidine ADP-ribosyltransferase family protein [Acinetobacter baumannii]|uniref:DarT ssDNA thymidine ADP-ribosyltransferase family protein n=1 Tax=Acinetobacter baumannii TaxID=470 RepID=UPI000DCFCDD4|nr:DarT ssDNA thymidine ADP-ribosyltransferase family protein [Acinetobacter baumannii]MDO7494073.1 DarT ssDNA thymidine ADP-ribosyltransferase family protein [Acinetobacter baumannii]
MSLKKLIESKRIEEVLHFTTNNGIVGILATGFLRSRFKLSEDQYLEHILFPNAAVRPEESICFDKKENWIDYVNLSISEINSRYFQVSGKWHNTKNIWWGILAFDPIIMEHDGVYFATTNNSYDCCKRGCGVNGLNALFSPVVQRKTNWNVHRGNRSDKLPTCEQAEVLYPQKVSTQFLRTIYVADEDHYDAVEGWLLEFDLQNVKVLICKEKFHGMPN